jgi:anti-sigma B factor antagonist
VTACPTCTTPLPTDAPDGVCPRCGRDDWFTWDDEDGPVLKPKGDLMFAHTFDGFLASYPFSPGSRLVLDLSDVHYIASEAIGRLMTLRKRLIAVQGRLILRRLHPDLEEIFRVTRIASFFEIEP